MPEKLGKDKHSSLLQKFVNYGEKSFITLCPVLFEVMFPNESKQTQP